MTDPLWWRPWWLQQLVDERLNDKGDEVSSERLNALIDEYAETTQFSRADLTDLARDVEDAEMFTFIVSAWMAGFRMRLESLIEMYKNKENN